MGDLLSIPGLGRSPGEGNGYPLQYSGLVNSMDRGTWQVTVHWVTRVGPELVNFTFTCLHIISSSQDFLRPRCSASRLPLGSLRWGWRKHPLVLLPKELRAILLTGLCNESYLLQGTQKCEDWSLKVQTDGEGLPPPHNEPLGADVMGVVLCIVSRCLEVAALDPQACCGKKEILETR